MFWTSKMFPQVKWSEENQLNSKPLRNVMRLRYLSFTYMPATAFQFYIKDGGIKNTLQKPFRYLIVSGMKDVNQLAKIFSALENFSMYVIRKG